MACKAAQFEYHIHLIPFLKVNLSVCVELVVTIFHLINFIISYFAEFVNSFENIKVLGFRKAQYNDGEYLHCTGYKSNDEYK